MWLKMVMVVALWVGVVVGRVEDELSSEEKALLLERHNRMRRQEAFENGATLIETEWDEALATKAQTLANACDATLPAGPDYPMSFGYSRTTKNSHLSQDFWMTRKRYFDFETASCDAHNGYVCSMYLNLVLAKGSSMGCGRNYCSKARRTMTEDAYFLVCYFDPPARNVGADYKIFQLPYAKGKPCMYCNNYYTYEDGLCKFNQSMIE